MATLGDILQAKQPDIWAQLTGQDPSVSTPGPEAPPPAPAAAAPAMPSPTPQSLPPINLQGPDLKDLAASQAAAKLAADNARSSMMMRHGAELMRQVGSRNHYVAPDNSDLEAARKAPLEAYAQREAARQAANKAVLEGLTGQKTQAETLKDLAHPQEEAAKLAEEQRYHSGELDAKAAATATTMRDTDERLRQAGYDRALQRDLKDRELSQDKARWDADRAARVAMLDKKLTALQGQQHNARASGLVKQAAALDASIADLEAQKKAADDASRIGGVISGGLEHIPIVGHALGSIVAPGASAVRGGAKAENESAATAIGGGAATQVRMNALEPLALDPSLSKKAIQERYDIKKQRLSGRRADLQNEAQSIGVNLAPPGGRQGVETGVPAAGPVTKIVGGKRMTKDPVTGQITVEE